MSSGREVVLPLRTVEGKVPAVSHVRSTLLASSLQTLRSKGYLDAYLRGLPPELHETLLGAVAGSWMPIEIGMAHYGAADGLGLTPAEQFEVGSEVSRRTQNAVLGLLARTAKQVGGVTPWMGLEQFQRMWDRLLVGGSGAVFRVGPKEARVEAHGNPLVRWAYFRNSWRGMLAGAAELFCSRAYVTEAISPWGHRDVFVMRLAWA